jgi:hypothetical protein
MSQITGTLIKGPGAEGSFACNALIGVWQLRVSADLAVILQNMVGMTLVFNGHQVGIPDATYGAVFQVDSVQESNDLRQAWRIR